MATIPVVDPRDRNYGIISAVLLLFLILLYLFLKTFEMADPPPVSYVMKMETGIDQLVLDNLKVETGGMGGGTPSNDPVADPKPQTQHVITKPKNPNTQTTTGQSSNTTAQNSQNTSTTTEQSNNPFGSGGSDGKNGGGSGGPFGNDQGNNGSGPGGPGSGANRIRLNDPTVDHIATNVTVTIHLKLTINENGFIVSAVNTSKTTTTDQRIINQVIAAVKSQVKYNKDPGSGLVTTYVTIKVNAT